MKYSREEIRNAYVAADSLVRSGKCTGDDVFAITGPFLDCTEIESISARFQQDSIGLLYALTGDGYRVAKKYSVSAEWYRKASGFTAVHGEIYAYMVCEHRITNHYPDALDAARRASEAMKKRPVLSRVGGFVMQWHCIFDRDWRSIFFNRARTLKCLEAEIAKNA